MRIKLEKIEMKSANKENCKVIEFKENQSTNETSSGIGGAKMTNSIYSLKNSQSTCL